MPTKAEPETYGSKLLCRFRRDFSTWIAGQIMIGLLLAGGTLGIQYHQGTLSRAALKENAIEIFLPYLFIIALFFGYHLARALYLVGKESHDAWQVHISQGNNSTAIVDFHPIVEAKRESKPNVVLFGVREIMVQEHRHGLRASTCNVYPRPFIDPQRAIVLQLNNDPHDEREVCSTGRLIAGLRFKDTKGLAVNLSPLVWLGQDEDVVNIEPGYNAEVVIAVKRSGGWTIPIRKVNPVGYDYRAVDWNVAFPWGGVGGDLVLTQEGIGRTLFSTNLTLLLAGPKAADASVIPMQHL